uniref:Caspase-8 n=1 Tax=Ciona savignyi TaxID=51511 RepID=I6UVT8_CIOSA|nr:caspase-8 [Ciona savignyi]
MDSEHDFRLLLHELCEGLTDEHVAMVRYLCKDAIPQGKDLPTAIDFISYFESKGWIQSGDLGFLAEVLYRINRHDLLKKLPGVKNRRDYEDSYLEQGQNFTAFRVTCFMLADELTLSDLKILKNLCCAKMSQRNLRMSEDVLTWLTCMEQEDLVSPDDLEFIIKILQRLDNQKPYKLFQKLRDGDNSIMLPKHKQKALMSSLHSHVAGSSNLYMNNNFYQSSSSKLEPQHHNNGNSRVFSNETLHYNASSLYRNPSYTTAPKSYDTHHVANERVFNVDDTTESFKEHQRNVPQNTSPVESSGMSISTSQSRDTMRPNSLLPASENNVVNAQQQHMTHYTPTSMACSTEYSNTENTCSNPITEQTVEATMEPTNAVYTDACVRNDVKYELGQNKKNTISKDGNIEKITLDKYPMERRGYCLVINNENFENNVNEDEVRRRLTMSTSSDYPVPNVGLKNRVGSRSDAESLKRLFISFGFTVDVKYDLDQRQIEKVIQEYTKKDHSSKDCFVCVVMSHGLAGCVYGVDGLSVSTSKISKSFRPDNCPSLIGKPKIFFFQACQGDRTMDGHSAPVDDVESDGLPGRQIVPSEADFLIGHSTVPGYLSYRSRTDGSWFISTLVESLDKYHKHEDLLSIMINVNQEMATKPFKQMPMPIATLRKKVFFEKCLPQPIVSTEENEE